MFILVKKILFFSNFSLKTLVKVVIRRRGREGGRGRLVMDESLIVAGN